MKLAVLLQTPVPVVIGAVLVEVGSELVVTGVEVVEEVEEDVEVELEGVADVLEDGLEDELGSELIDELGNDDELETEELVKLEGDVDELLVVTVGSGVLVIVVDAVVEAAEQTE